MDRRGYQDFPWKFFCLTVPKNSVGELFSVSLISGSEKVFASEGCHDFVSKFSVSQCQKNS